MKKFFRSTIVFPAATCIVLFLFIVTSPVAYGPTSLARRIDVNHEILKGETSAKTKKIVARKLLVDLTKLPSKSVWTPIGRVNTNDYEIPLRFFIGEPYKGKSIYYPVTESGLRMTMSVMPSIGKWTVFAQFRIIVLYIVFSDCWFVWQISRVLREYKKYDILEDAEIDS